MKSLNSYETNRGPPIQILRKILKHILLFFTSCTVFIFIVLFDCIIVWYSNHAGKRRHVLLKITSSSTHWSISRPHETKNLTEIDNQ